MRTSASVFGRDRFGFVRGRASALGHVPFAQGTTTHNRRGLLLLMSSGGRWYGCVRGKGAIVPKKGVARRIGGRRFLLSRWIWTVLGVRTSKVYHQLHHGGILLFQGFCDFCVERGRKLWEDANKPQRMPTVKMVKHGAFLEPVSRISKRPFSGVLNCSVCQGGRQLLHWQRTALFSSNDP